MSLRNFKRLETFHSSTNVLVVLLEETLSGGETTYSVKLVQNGSEGELESVILDFSDYHKALEFLSLLRS